MAYPLQRTAIICMTSLMALFVSGPVAALPPDGPTDHLALTAWMGIDGGNFSGIIVEVTVNGTKDWGRPDADGRVDLVLPADAVAMIHFRKHGHLTKTISVDTHNLQADSFSGKQNSLSFGVKMEPDAGKDGLVYAGPVGAIAFDAATGGLLIMADQQLVPYRQQKVEF